MGGANKMAGSRRKLVDFFYLATTMLVFFSFREFFFKYAFQIFGHLCDGTSQSFSL